jgi:hypothetical protein
MFPLSVTQRPSGGSFASRIRRGGLVALAIGGVLAGSLVAPQVTRANTPCTNVTVSSDAVSSTLSIGTVVHFTAHATCPATPVYQWFVGAVRGNGQPMWHAVQPYSTTNTYTWNTTGEQPGSYFVSVWAENQGGPAGSFDVNANPPEFTLKAFLSACITNPQVCEQAPTLTPSPLVLQPTKVLSTTVEYMGWNSTFCSGPFASAGGSAPNGQISVGFSHSGDGGWPCDYLFDYISRGGVGFDIGKVIAYIQAHGAQSVTLGFTAEDNGDSGLPINLSCIGQIVSAGDAWESLSTGPWTILGSGGGWQLDAQNGIDLVPDSGSQVQFGFLGPQANSPVQVAVDVSGPVELAAVFNGQHQHFVFVGNDESHNNSGGNSCELTLDGFSLTITPNH